MVTITHEATAAAAFALSGATLEVLNDKGLIPREEGRLILERAAQNVEGNPPHGWHAAQALRFAKEGPRFAQMPYRRRLHRRTCARSPVGPRTCSSPQAQPQPRKPAQML